MITLPSASVQNKFGSIARTVTRGEPVAVSQYGEPTLLILPYAEGAEAWHRYKVQQMVAHMDSMSDPPMGTPDLSLEELNQLVHELR